MANQSTYQPHRPPSARVKPSRLTRAIAAAAALGVLGLASDAHGGGLYFSDRGVRPMGRGGAFVAGADDLGAIWYNPAGLSDAKTSFLADFTWLRFSNEYTRRLRIVDADDTVRVVESPTVSGASPVLPLPTIAGSYQFDKEGTWTIAGGMFAPYVALASYDRSVGGQPSPARYTLGSFDGTRMLLPGAWLAYKPAEWIRVGVGIHALIGKFVSTIAFTASPPDRLVAAPEQPDYDADAQMSVDNIIAPTANAGVIVVPNKHVRIGVSGQLPTHVASDATLKVRLPSSVIFDSVNLTGDQAHVQFDLPAILRFGVEFRPSPKTRIEVGYAREFWSIHDVIRVRPKNISFDGITGGPPSVTMPTIDVPRQFRDSNSYRLGAEHELKIKGYKFLARAGISYEDSAIPPAYVSLSSLDFNKTILSLGASMFIGKHYRFDALFSQVFAEELTVSTTEADIVRINPLSGNAPKEAVNGGTYKASANLIGMGLNYLF